ncbi:MAG: hypothetical protein HW405_802 [Candidatus Berkelbacteria bacterium]|nr:hypothetical protein [Candidatus Berkelbacteria bacterium]
MPRQNDNPRDKSHDIKKVEKFSMLTLENKQINNDNSYLETKKEHKKWFDSEVGMGKQRGKPKAVPFNIKKAKGSFKKHQHK